MNDRNTSITAWEPGAPPLAPQTWSQRLMGALKRLGVWVWGLTQGLVRGTVVALASLALMAVRWLSARVADVWGGLMWLLARLSDGPSGLREVGQVLDPWLRAFWPLLAVVIAGFTFFQRAVLQSIASTPHPEIVYTIFAVALAAALLAANTLARYLQDEQLALALLARNESDRRALILSLTDSDFQSALRLSVSPMGHQPGEHRDLVESEMLACEDQAEARLNLPSYLGGSLIGIGLVGTFVGLLAALADLAGVFSALMGGNVGAAGSDPMALFSGMLVKLQEPMKGMATAFVASLYGLMGSLLLGLVVYSVRKSGAQSAARMRELLRDQDRLTTLAMHEHPSHDFDASALNHGLDVLNKHQEVVELLLTDLIQWLHHNKASEQKQQRNTHGDQA